MSRLAQWLGFYMPVEEYSGGETNTKLPVFSFAKEGIRKKRKKILLPIVLFKK